LQVVLSVSKGNGVRPDSGMELDSHVDLKVRPDPAEQHDSMAGPQAAPEVLLELKEGDRRLIIYDEKQNLVRSYCALPARLPEQVHHGLGCRALFPSINKRLWMAA